MRCPVCHSDTTSALPRCTRCNAQLDQVTVQDGEPAPRQTPLSPSPPEEPTRQDQPAEKAPVSEELTRQDQPEQVVAAVPQPGGDSWSPGSWPSPPGQGSPTGGEHITSLSPEPWSFSPSPMWQPPKRRSKVLPYVLTGLGVWVLAVVALAIIFWPQSGGSSPGATPQQQPQSVQQPQQETAPSAGSAPGDEQTPGALDADGRQQALQIDRLLSDMASTRSELGAVVSAGCGVSDLERIRGQRQEQLATAETLQVDALPDGEALKEALTRALRISIESNNLYLGYAPGCPSESAAEDVNSRATRAKSEVIGYWNAIAAEYGLPSRDSGSI